MINIHKQRLELKLKLWETAGFTQFVEDLTAFMGNEMAIKTHVMAIKKIYEAQLKGMEPKSKFKQGKLGL